jgi:hypothetical protein
VLFILTNWLERDLKLESPDPEDVKKLKAKRYLLEQVRVEIRNIELDAEHDLYEPGPVSEEESEK